MWERWCGVANFPTRGPWIARFRLPHRFPRAFLASQPSIHVGCGKSNRDSTQIETSGNAVISKKSSICRQSPNVGRMYITTMRSLDKAVPDSNPSLHSRLCSRRLRSRGGVLKYIQPRKSERLLHSSLPHPIRTSNPPISSHIPIYHFISSPIDGPNI